MRSIPSQFWRGSAYFIYLAICIEVALQGFYYFTAGDFLFRRLAIPIYAPAPYAGFSNRPGLSFDHRTNEFRARYYINRAGFRVPHPGLEYTRAKSSNIYRIMLLGPSFAFGWGVNYELSFAYLLQRLLQERGFAGDKKIEMIDAGVPGMPPAPQLTWFERVGKDYAPDLVVQLVYGSMAYSKNDTAPFAAVNDDGYLLRLDTDATLRWRESLKKFATVFYGWMLWATLNSDLPIRSDEQPVSGVDKKSAPTDFEPAHPQVRDAMQFYNKLAAIVRQAGARLLVVYIPPSYAIDRKDEARWRRFAIRDIPQQIAFEASFVRYLNGCLISSIDVTEQLRKSARGGKRMYYWLDIHWTPAGNATAAQAVADYLTGPPRSTSPR